MKKAMKTVWEVYKKIGSTHYHVVTVFNVTDAAKIAITLNEYNVDKGTTYVYDDQEIYKEIYDKLKH
jgi:hypothetical protein